MLVPSHKISSQELLNWPNPWAYSPSNLTPMVKHHLRVRVRFCLYLTSPGIAKASHCPLFSQRGIEKLAADGKSQCLHLGCPDLLHFLNVPPPLSPDFCLWALLIPPSERHSELTSLVWADFRGRSLDPIIINRPLWERRNFRKLPTEMTGKRNVCMCNIS